MRVVELEDITDANARRMQTSDLIIGLTAASNLYMVEMTQGGHDEVFKQIAGDIEARVKFGKLTAEEGAHEVAEARVRVDKHHELALITIEVYSTEINRRVPIPEKK